ncbi:MAG: TfoX/Sxy family protein [Candidatus Binatia bacterium]
MAKIFLDRLVRMIDRATSGRIGDVTVECKHFFSGAAVYAKGRICASLTPVGFAIKLPKESRDILLKRGGVKPLRYFAKGPVKKEYVVLSKALVSDVTGFRRLLEISIAYVLRSSKRSKRRRLSG